MAKKRSKKLSGPAQRRVSAKIRKLREEGKPRDQAAAIAPSMERRGELGPRGGRKRKRNR